MCTCVKTTGREIFRTLRYAMKMQNYVPYKNRDIVPVETVLYHTLFQT